MTGDAVRHTPVMVDQVVDVLRPRDNAIYVDATFGAGGYSRALLNAARCRVMGIDRDLEAVSDGVALEKEFSGRLTVLCGRFGDMKKLLADVGVDKADGIAFDFGVSSMQLDSPERGFSFRHDGPLDMRMGCQGSHRGTSAADVVNNMPEDDLASIIYRYGEERSSRRIARAIVETRTQEPFYSTGQLASLVRRIVRGAKDGIDPATRTFQALRIYVNDELAEIDRGLSEAESLLCSGGRLAVVSFHSLEDRKVKNFLRRRSGGAPRPSRHLPGNDATNRPPSFNMLARGIIKPATEEISANPRARSARMRAAERTDAQPWPDNDLPTAGGATP